MILALRALWRRPGFTLVAVITMALGIGANAALFSVVNSVLLSSFGYSEPERLVQISGTNRKNQQTGVSIPDLVAFQQRAHSFEKIGASWITTFTLIGGREPENIYGQMVSKDVFPALSAIPLRGRTFTEGDYAPEAPRVAVIAYSLWQSTFAADSGIIGRRVLLNGAEHTIIGVMRPEFQYPHPVFRLWTAWKFSAADLSNRGLHTYTLVGRMRRGIKFEGAQTELLQLSDALAKEFPDTNGGWKSVLEPVSERLLRDVRPVLFALMGAVGFVLLIACLNVSNLLMARGMERSRELAVRAALGASPMTLAKELLRESLLISTMGGLLGLVFAQWCLRGLLAALPARTFPVLPRADQASIDGRVLAVATLACVITGLLFGLLPALRFSRPDLEDALREGGRSNAGGRSTRRWLSALIITEAALSVVLLVGAGLMIRSFQKLLTVNPGFRPEHVLTVQIPSEWRNLARANDPDEARRTMDYFEGIVEKVRTLPGVHSAGLTTVLPMSNIAINTTMFIQGRPAPLPGEEIRVAYRGVSQDYFKVMGIPLIRGRYFTNDDRVDRPQVAIISDALARQYWPNEDALGKQFALSNGARAPRITVVGIVGGVRYGRLRSEPEPELYTSYVQTLLAPQISTLALRTNGDPMAIAASVRNTIHALNPNQPVAEVRTMTRVVEESVSTSRLYAGLLTLLASLALLLAAAGIFAVISWTVSRSTHEIGIRMALGASRRDVLGKILGRVLAEAMAGAVLGIAGSIALTRVLETLLYNVTRTDAATFTLAAVVLGFVALLAAYLPGRRAIAIDPMKALRTE